MGSCGSPDTSEYAILKSGIVRIFLENKEIEPLPGKFKKMTFLALQKRTMNHPFHPIAENRPRTKVIPPSASPRHGGQGVFDLGH